MIKSLNCVFVGKSADAVPGVDFKEWVQKEANNLSVTGWIRSLSDGRLEVLAQGSEKNLQELHARLLQGPPLDKGKLLSTSMCRDPLRLWQDLPFSKVEKLECKWIDHEKAFQKFELCQ
jgi:acylphosphatase